MATWRSLQRRFRRWIELSGWKPRASDQGGRRAYVTSWTIARLLDVTADYLRTKGARVLAWMLNCCSLTPWEWRGFSSTLSTTDRSQEMSWTATGSWFRVAPSVSPSPTYWGT